MAAKKTARTPATPSKPAKAAKKTAAAPPATKTAAKAPPPKAQPDKAPTAKAPPPKAKPDKAPTAKAPPPKAKPDKAPTAKAPPPKATKPAAPAPAVKASLGETVRRAAAKVAQVAAAAAIKVLDPDAGRRAPSFELSDQAGNVVSAASLAGKPYLLYFYPKNDTPGCTKEACDIRDNFGRFGKQGLRVFGVSPDSTQSHTKFIKKYGLPFTLLSDPDKSLATAYGVWAEKSNYGKKYMGIVRSTFLIGADGVIKKAYRGVKVNGHIDAVLQDAQAML